jgi:hypothetical protein
MSGFKSFVFRYVLSGLLVSTTMTMSGEPSPQTLPPEIDSPEAREIRNKISAILLRLSDEVWANREKASQDLLQLGMRAVPLLAAHVNDQDLEVAIRVRNGLAQLRGQPGEAVEGLTLSAALVGPKPRPGQAVTLWLTITNTSDQDVHVLQSFWSLNLRPESEKGKDMIWTVLVDTPTEMTAQDFLCLKPGQSVCQLMDAELSPDAKSASLTQAYLEITPPAKALEAVKGKAFSGTQKLVSGPIEMYYAENSPNPDPEIEALVGDYLTHKNDGLSKLEALAKDPAATGTVLKVIRSGLRRANGSERWKFFEFLCRRPHPALEDDLVRFLDCYGPQMKQESTILNGLRSFGEVLTPERRRNLIQRAALAMVNDWRILSNLAIIYMPSGDPFDRGVTARIYLMLNARGDRRPEVMNWLAMELFSTPDPRLKDAKKALELAEAAVKAEPENTQYLFTLAFISGKKEDLDNIMAKVVDPSAQNTLAWTLATNFPTKSNLAGLALELAEKSLKSTRPENSLYPYVLDTLAVAQAANDNYVKALELEEKAFEKLNPADTEHRAYAARVARFTALAAGDKDERPSMVMGSLRLRSDAACKALLKRLEVEKNPLVRNEVIQLLKEHFSTIPEVVKAVK